MKKKITTYKAYITTKISTIAKNDRVYVLAGSSKARHGSRLITVLPYTCDCLDSCMLSYSTLLVNRTKFAIAKFHVIN